MKQRMKISAILLVIALMITAICNHGVAAAAKAVKIGNGMYTVTNEKKKEARFDKVSSKTKTTLVIPATVKIGKITYKVIAVKANALKGNTKIKKLTIGKNVKKIGKNSFSGCKNLKSVNIKTTKLTLKSVGKNAFKGLNSKVKIKVPKSKLTAYQKLLKARGVNGKKQVIKSDKTQPTVTKKPTVIPDPTVALHINASPDKGLYWPNTVTEITSDTGKRVELSIRTDIPLEMYGYWEEVKNVKSDYKSICTACQLVVTSNEDRIIHRIIHGYQSGHTGYTVRTKGNSAFDASVWHSDNTLCSIVYHATLPEGLEIVEDSISVAQLSWRDTLIGNVTTDDYKVSIEGNNLTISINNIKTGGFCFSDGDIRYLPIVASFSAKLTDSAATVNSVSANVSFNQGKYSKTIATNTVTVNKK